MRSSLGLVLAVGIFGCQEPRCAEGEQRIGVNCHVEAVDAAGNDAGGTETSRDGLDAAIDTSVTADSLSGESGPVARDATLPAEEPASSMRDGSTQRVFSCPPRQCAEWPIGEPLGKLNPSFSRDADTVTDQVTKLVWQRRQPSFEGTHAEAERYCENLTLGGFEDWRLPSLVEVRSLFDVFREPSRIVRDVYLPEDEVYPPPYWWTSAIDLEGVRIAFNVALSHATAMRALVEGPGKTGVRCVRGGTAATGSRYTISEDGSYVTDNWTKLTWRRRAEPDLLTIEAATARCESYSFGWRLPTTKELYSLVVATLEPTIDREAFPDTPVGPFWAHEHGKPLDEEYVNFGAWGPFSPGAKYGIRDSVPRPFQLHTRCVR